MRRRPVLLALAAAATALLLGGAPAVAADDSIDIQVVIPADGVLTVDSAQLRWGLSHEASSGAYAFGCQFLSAGVAGDTGSSRAWTEADGFYRGSAGNVRIVKPGADGKDRGATWATRCLDRDGAPVTASTSSPTTESEVVVDGGTGTVDQGGGDARISWRGSFTVAFYGGLSYWSATDPVLVVRDGVGTLTATASGYGADREDTSRWVTIPPRTVTLARFARVDLGTDGFTATPDYLGVKVDVAGSPQAARTAANADHWGSFPQDFVDLQVQTGQAAYWNTSGGERDPFKAALPATVSYDSSRPVTPPRDPDGSGVTPGGLPPANPITTPPPTAPQAVTPPASGGTPVAPSVTGPDAAATGAFPATQAMTVGAASALIPLVQDAAGWLTGQDPLLLGGLAALAVLGALAALGLWRGWLVAPWTGWRT